MLTLSIWPGFKRCWRGPNIITLFIMSLPQRQKLLHLDWYWLLRTCILLLVYLPSSNLASGDLFVINTSTVCDVCMKFCENSQVNAYLTNDCQRGCRLFDTALNKEFSFEKLNDAVALTSCQQSCIEAYDNSFIAKTACLSGCNYAQQEYVEVYMVSLQLLRDLQGNMTFFQFFKKIFDLASVVVFPFALDVDASNFADVPSRSSNHNVIQLKVGSSSSAVNQQNKDEESSTGGANQEDALPNWMVKSAFVFFTLGVVMMLGVCFYCCVSAHYLAQRRREMKAEADLPPSYEQLIRDRPSHENMC